MENCAGVSNHFSYNQIVLQIVMRCTRIYVLIFNCIKCQWVIDRKLLSIPITFAIDVMGVYPLEGWRNWIASICHIQIHTYLKSESNPIKSNIKFHFDHFINSWCVSHINLLNWTYSMTDWLIDHFKPILLYPNQILEPKNFPISEFIFLKSKAKGRIITANHSQSCWIIFYHYNQRF